MSKHKAKSKRLIILNPQYLKHKIIKEITQLKIKLANLDPTTYLFIETYITDRDFLKWQIFKLEQELKSIL